MKGKRKIISILTVMLMLVSMAGTALAQERVTITYSMWGDSEEVRVLQETMI